MDWHRAKSESAPKLLHWNQVTFEMNALRHTFTLTNENVIRTGGAYFCLHLFIKQKKNKNEMKKMYVKTNVPK